MYFALIGPIFLYVAIRPSGGTWRDISSQRFHTCGVGGDGSLWCWGSNDEGQLGIGGFVEVMLAWRSGLIEAEVDELVEHLAAVGGGLAPQFLRS